ncbi:MAG: SH3 domain-containing protein [Candidatus Aminicenantes bacterium]|nr:SH3 domain-containing protein [Candidatus Aminicenantes bacterium]
MKKKTPLVIVLACLIAVAALLAAETFIVKVRTTSLRSSPKFYASTVTGIKAGDRLEQVAIQDDWIQVKTASGATGWIHKSALEPKQFNLLASNKNLKTQATADEVALASKGFNKQVEDSYRAKNKNISFVWVDKMLLIKIPLNQEINFLKDGRLADFGSGK